MNKLVLIGLAALALYSFKDAVDFDAILGRDLNPTSKSGQEKLAKYDYEVGVSAAQENGPCVSYFQTKDNARSSFGGNNQWCEDFKQIVRTSPDYDPAALHRWQDATYDQLCSDYIIESRPWCAAYLKFVKNSSAFSATAREAFLKKNFRHACFGQNKTSRSMSSGCYDMGSTYRTVRNWRYSE